MKTEIDLSIIETALLKLGEATARQIADETGLEAKDVTRALNTMLTGAVEREKRGNEYVYWLTTASAPTKPTAKPRAAAVAVFSALETGTDPVPDLTEQLRQAHAERLAMSQTIIAICCAIGRDPGQTTTADLPQALRDYVDAQVSGATLDLLSVIADIRAAIGDADRIMQSDLAAHIKAELDSGKQAREEATRLHLACNGLTNDLMTPAGPFYDQVQGLRAAAMLIYAQHEHIQSQAEEISYQTVELRRYLPLDKAVHELTSDLIERPASTEDWVRGLRAASMLIDAQHAHLHAQAVQIESMAAELDAARATMDRQDHQITELRARVEAQILAGHNSASSAHRLLTEVHEVLSAGWPHAYDFNPCGHTTLQLAQKISSDFKSLYDAHEKSKARSEIPDAFFVLRHDWKHHVSRHKTRDAAHRKVTSALRAGAGQADIYAVKRIATGKRRPVIESV